MREQTQTKHEQVPAYSYVFVDLVYIPASSSKYIVNKLSHKASGFCRRDFNRDYVRVGIARIPSLNKEQ